MTTIACVFVRGHVAYTSEYVTRLAAMVKRWMDRPYRFVCLSDRGYLGPHVETIQIPWSGEFRGWWAKLQLFRHDLGLTGRVLYLDLDTLIVGPLGPILDYPAPFALLPHAGRFEGKDGLAVVKHFNSSVMVWNAGEQTHLHARWTPEVATRLWGDQDWIGEQCSSAATLPAEWCPRFSELSGPCLPSDAKVILMKTPKNVRAARMHRWVREIWRG
jgi:hypothetical protein